MKTGGTIALTTFALWLIQLGLFGLLLTSWFTHFIVKFFVAFGVPLSDGWLQTFLTQVLNVLTFPVRLLLPAGWFGSTSLAVALRLAINSAIWGIALGIVIQALRKRMRENKVR